MRLLFASAALLALAACAVTPAPDRVRLSAQELGVRFQDGSTCTADIQAAPTGQLRGCAQPLDYAVDIQHPSYAQGSIVEPYFEPYATIKLTRPTDGRRWLWRTPEDRPDGKRSTRHLPR